MPYTNIQHPSNTRTTVTLVMSIIFGVSIIPTTALGAEPQAHKALVFSLENADVPTLYQAVKVKIDNPAVVPGATGPNPILKDTDRVYFLKTTATDTPIVPCVAPSSTSVTLWNVVPTDNSAVATVIIKEAEFAVGQTYKMCYKREGVSPTYEEVPMVKGASKASAAFTIRSSMFTAYKMTPTTVYVGHQGSVSLSITEADQTNVGVARAIGKEEIAQNAYLVPCPTDKKCSKDDIASICSIKSKETSADTIKTALVTGFGTGPLTTTFNAPANPTSPYRICVPYCFKGDSCTADTVSWALVNSEPIIFKPSNPSYTLLPKSPQARTWTQITFTGTDLTAKDKIRILPRGEECSTTAELLPNIEHTHVRAASGTATSSVFIFRLKDVLSESVTGQVCYARVGAEGTTETWVPVYNVAVQAGGDLVISPLQPTGFTISPASPEIGQVLTVTFTGTGLEAGDLSYLVKCPIEGSDQGPPLKLSNGISSDLCDERQNSKRYTCDITKDVKIFNCKDINAQSAGEEMRLCPCYKKKDTSYSLVDGSVTVLPKSPTYTITPYPFYVGQGAKLKFTGTDLSDADEVKIIAQDGSCGGEDNSLSTVFIGKKVLKDGSVKGAAEVTYTIMGSASGCFAVCYRRGTVWTVLTNSDTSDKTTPGKCTGPSPSSFITDMTLRYALSLQVPSKQQTVTVTFQDDRSYSVGSLIIIPIKKECTNSLCEGLAPCEHVAKYGDFYKVTSATSGVFMATLKSSYLICTKAQADLPWIPIRNANSAAEPHYTFDVGDKVLDSYTQSPSTWRIGMQMLEIEFSGTSVNGLTDNLAIVADTDLLSPKGVCGLSYSSLKSILQATRKTDLPERTSAFNVKKSKDAVLKRNALHICYYSGPAAQQVPNYYGAITFEASNPSGVQVEISVPELRAGLPVTLSFSAVPGGQLDPAKDTVYFYTHSVTTASCQCDADLCDDNDLVSPPIQLSGTEQKTLWENPKGFLNYDKELKYTVCYVVNATERATYLRDIPVKPGSPLLSVTVPPIPEGSKTTTLSATAISSTIPALLITSVVFLYLYN